MIIWINIAGIIVDLCTCNMATVKQTNEPHCEKEHVDISDTAKFQSSGPNAGEMADIWKNWKYCKRQMYGSQFTQAWLPIHLSLIF